MDSIRKAYRNIFWRILRNRCGYTDEEVARIRQNAWAKQISDLARSLYWFRVEMVKTNRCTAGWKQGDCLYLDSLGEGRFEGEVIEVRMSCYGAPFPYGDCGQVIMQFSLEEGPQPFHQKET